MVTQYWISTIIRRMWQVGHLNLQCHVDPGFSDVD